MRLKPLFALVACMLLSSYEWCGAANPQGETAFTAATGTKAASTEKRLTVKLAVNDIYGIETACSCIKDIACREYVDLQKTLLEKYNIDLQLSYFVEEYDLIDTLLSGQFDGALSKPWLAYINAQKSGVNYKRIVDLLDINNNQWLTGHFLVKIESPIKTLSDINGLRLMTGRDGSYEKYHAAMKMIKENNIKPSQLLDKASCMECVGALMDDVADVIVISDYALVASCIVDFANPEDFRTIAQTEKMPLTSVMLDMSKVNEADALRLQNALLEISGDNAPKELVGKGFVKPAAWNPSPFSTAKE